MPKATRHPLALRVPPLLVWGGFGLLGWLAAFLSRALSIDYPGRPWVTGACVIGGLVFALSGVASFRRARTTVNPMKPDATTALVVSGIYRVTRNPMYLGFLLFLVAEIAWLANPVACLTAPLFVLYLNRFQILPEEDFLRAQFGPEYDVYVARVRRWL